MIPTPLFDNAGKPSDALLKLLQLTNVAHDGTLAGIRDATQREWYQEGRLRKDVEEQHASLKDQVMPLFRTLGMVDAVTAPVGGGFFNVLVLGATVTAVRKRYRYFRDEQRKQGWLWIGMYFLGSTRKLGQQEIDLLLKPDNPDLPFSPDWEPILDTAVTEAQMMSMVAHQTVIRDVMVLSTPEVEGRNANTGDTVRYWKEVIRCEEPDVLVVSSQPYVSYQGLTAQNVLGHPYRVTAIGYAAPPTITVSGYLDNVAKLIYELAIAEGV